MVTVIHIIKFIIKVLLFIILLPVILIWLFIKYRRYKFIFKLHLTKAGMPKEQAKLLVKEIKIKTLSA